MHVPYRSLDAAGESGAVEVPDSERLMHLQFRRYAGCPICNRHLRFFVDRHDEIRRAGIAEVAVFHSSHEVLTPLALGFPFPLIPDPGKHLYREFGVEQSWRAITHPKAWLAATAGWLKQPPSLPADDGSGHLGLPADFLIAPDARILAVGYGAHADDHWSVDDVLRLAAEAGSAGNGGEH
ncbi:Peroxiredoxin [Ruania alba]|uniref:Peroxiredoxin n=2 Tax=Ruania alba TaxID=648782 RepID=A0A1H5KUM7_9MICO|nr:Peroxiredoxin [Ruania alba]